MARKKQEIALQSEIETQEEWEEMLAKEGISVVDVYQEWCGPCKGMVANFRRIKNELGDDLLHFVVAKADTVDALEKYRGKCKPCFLFFAGGVLVEVIRGANSPLISRAITEQLNQEHKVLDGNAERKEIRDMEVAADDDREKGAEDEDETEGEDLEGIRHEGGVVMYDSLPEATGEASKKTVTVAIIKPDVVAAGKVDEIIEQMKSRGIEILEQQEKQLTEEEAREFYGHKKDEDFFEDLVKFMSSGPSVVLVLTKGDTGEGIIEEWRSLLGPASVEEAKEQAPESLRAQYGSEKDNYVNALHGSDTADTALRELAFFFPQFEPPVVPGMATSARPRTPSAAKPKIQRTLALIRPDALREKKDEILQKISEAGFQVAMQKEVQLSKEQAEEFYKEHKGEDYFDELTTRMSNGPLLALALAREDAISSWREKLGPKEVDKAKEEEPESLRAQFAIDDVPVNPLHGSDTPEAAQNEINYFFPVQQTVAVVKPDAFQTKEEIMQRVREAGFHIAARKETELTKDVAEQFYAEHKDKDYFNDLTEHMTSGPSLFMVLTREDAVDGWRSLMGHQADPVADKESEPNSLRAQYGTDIKANALHGSSTSEHAMESIKLVFGEEVEYDEDGMVKDTAAEKEAAEAAAAAAAAEEEANKSVEEKAENESLEKGEGEEGTTEGDKEAGSEEKKEEGTTEAEQSEEKTEQEGVKEGEQQEEEKKGEDSDGQKEEGEQKEDGETKEEYAEGGESEAKEATPAGEDGQKEDAAPEEKEPESQQGEEKKDGETEEEKQPEEEQKAEEDKKEATTADETQEEPKSADETQEEPKSTEETPDEPKSTEEPQEEPKSTEETQDEPKSTEETPEEPKSTEETQEEPKSTEETQEEPKSTEETQEEPKSTEETQEEAKAKEEETKPTEGDATTAEETQEEPKGTEEENKPKDEDAEKGAECEDKEEEKKGEDVADNAEDGQKADGEQKEAEPATEEEKAASPTGEEKAASPAPADGEKPASPALEGEKPASPAPEGEKPASPAPEGEDKPASPAPEGEDKPAATEDGEEQKEAEGDEKKEEGTNEEEKPPEDGEKKE